MKKEIGSLAQDDGLSTVINGRDIKTGKPRSVSIRAMDIIEPVRNYYDKIAELATSVLVKLPPEVSAEIRHAGVYVSGVSSSVYDLEKYYRKKLGMKVSVAENGLMSVALGGGITVANPNLIKKLALKR